MLQKPLVQSTAGKVSVRDERMARLLDWAPWVSPLLALLPLPIVFLLLFAAATTTDSAAVYLLLSFVSLGAGLVVGLFLLILLLVFRKRWRARLRDRLAVDGITATEVPWFSGELSSEERAVWTELKQRNPLLADAYCETLAARLTASRILSKARQAILKVERQINRTRYLSGVDTNTLLSDLTSDRERFDQIRNEAKVRLAEAKVRLQTIEAAANRSLSETETELMLQRLTAAQDHFPLAIEMLELERKALQDTRAETKP
jgi:hypothetical protein